MRPNSLILRVSWEVQNTGKIVAFSLLKRDDYHKRRFERDRARAWAAARNPAIKRYGDRDAHDCDLEGWGHRC